MISELRGTQYTEKKKYNTIVFHFIAKYLDTIRLNIFAISVLENEIISNIFFINVYTALPTVNFP